MPAKVSKAGGGKYRVQTPGGTKAKGTTRAKGEAQARLLNAKEHDPEFRPRRQGRG